MACEWGREANPHLKLGICGEHGGNPKSISFFHEAGLDYVSCSPFRVPGARPYSPRDYRRLPSMHPNGAG